MPIYAATSRPCECSLRYILLKAVAKGKPAGPRPFLENFSLFGNGATSGLSQRGQASPYICYIFLLILMEKTKSFYPKFYVFFFLPDDGENRTKDGLHRKFNAFLCVISIFRKSLFPFLSFDFLQKFVAPGGPYLKKLLCSKKKIKK